MSPEKIREKFGIPDATSLIDDSRNVQRDSSIFKLLAIQKESSDPIAFSLHAREINLRDDYLVKISKIVYHLNRAQASQLMKDLQQFLGEK